MSKIAKLLVQAVTGRSRFIAEMYVVVLSCQLTHQTLNRRGTALDLIQIGPQGPTVRNRTVGLFPALSWCRFLSSGGAFKSQVQEPNTVTESDFPLGLMWAPEAVPELSRPRRLREWRMYFPHCNPRNRRLSNAAKMGAGLTKAREILHARHNFPHSCGKTQLLMANRSTCAASRRDLAENLAPYCTIPHGWAFWPRLVSDRFPAAHIVGRLLKDEDQYVP